MNTAAYFNEVDPEKAAWLRELIRDGLIAPGEVDERPIQEVTAGDLDGYDQHHFFAGIGVWSYALRLAGWPDDEPVWTNSCPCQSFSAAGNMRALDDPRHLWPHMNRLIRSYQPGVVLGEQVASKSVIGPATPGRKSDEDSLDPAWIDLVLSDLEAAHYAAGAIAVPACSVGAPHVRLRTWVFAERFPVDGRRREQSGRLADTLRARREGGVVDGVADADRERLSRERLHVLPGESRQTVLQASGGSQADWATACDGFWRNPDWTYCRDGKLRPLIPGTQPLAHDVASRVVRGGDPSIPIDVASSEARRMRLAGYGDAIVADLAAEFIKSYMESTAQ